VFALLLEPLPAFPAYLIVLKNAEHFVTSSYWETKDQVSFYQSGGIVSIEKSAVAAIKESDVGYIEMLDLPAKPATPVEPTAGPPSQSEQGAAAVDPAEEEQKEVDLSKYRAMKTEIIARYRDAKERQRAAIQSRDRVAQQTINRELKKIEFERTNIAVEVRKANKGILPEWWRRSEPEEE